MCFLVKRLRSAGAEGPATCGWDGEPAVPFLFPSPASHLGGDRSQEGIEAGAGEGGARPKSAS